MSDIQLTRADILQLEPISNTNTMKLLPVGKTKKQKLVIGDDSGTLGCFEFKRGETTTVFQCRPFEGPISCVALGGPSQKRDKVFASHNQSIVGISKKGKEFFHMTSSVTEAIRCIAVEDTRIWTGCDHIFNIYDSGKDTAFYMSRDKINSLFVDHISSDNDFEAVLACQDSCLRVLQGSQLFTEVPTSNAVTVAASTNGEDYFNSSSRIGASSMITYGMEDGSFGTFQLNSSGHFNFIWQFEEQLKRSPINCMKIFDVTKDGYNEIVIGRDDGRLDIYAGGGGGDIGIGSSSAPSSSSSSLRHPRAPSNHLSLPKSLATKSPPSVGLPVVG